VNAERIGSAGEAVVWLTVATLASPELRALGENAALSSLTKRVLELEDRADELHNTELKTLFKASGRDPMAFLVGSELSDRPENVLDRCEDVANQVSSIVVEHV
jgi:uncharacterized protein